MCPSEMKRAIEQIDIPYVADGINTTWPRTGATAVVDIYTEQLNQVEVRILSTAVRG